MQLGQGTIAKCIQTCAHHKNILAIQLWSLHRLISLEHFENGAHLQQWPEMNLNFHFGTWHTKKNENDWEIRWDNLFAIIWQSYLAFRLLRELYGLWWERIPLLHWVLQPHQPEARHAAQETEALKIPSTPQCTRCASQGPTYLLEGNR